MEPTDITVDILRDIRDEARKTNEEIRKTNERVDTTNLRLESLRSELVKRQTETEIRLATEIVAVAGAVREVRDVLRQDVALRARVDDHERRITAIEQRGA